MSDTTWSTIPEAAAALAVSTKTIRRWIASGHLKAKRVGPRLIRVDITDAGRPIGGRR